MVVVHDLSLVAIGYQEYLLGLLDIMTRSTDQLINIFTSLSTPVSAVACTHASTRTHTHTDTPFSCTHMY